LHYKKPFKNSYKETGQKGMVMKAQLVESVKAGDVAEVARMLLAGADVNSRDEEGATLLMLAAYVRMSMLKMRAAGRPSVVRYTTPNKIAALPKSCKC
jgi:hypothetical protein